MSVQDARISAGLPSHPKTKKLIRQLGEGGAWFLVRLFLWTATNRSDGNLAGMTSEDIELAIDWSGDDGKFVAALASVGFLEGSEGSWRIHGWAEHNPWAAGFKGRSASAKAAAKARWGNRNDA